MKRSISTEVLSSIDSNDNSQEGTYCNLYTIDTQTVIRTYHDELYSIEHNGHYFNGAIIVEYLINAINNIPSLMH